MEFILVENIDIVMRQTNYTKEEAEQKLSIHNNNILDTVREYLNIKENEQLENETAKNETVEEAMPENLRNIKNMRNILKQTKPIQPTMENKEC
jgi:hypothetical protein